MSKRAKEAALKAVPNYPPETYADEDEYIEVESARSVHRTFYRKGYEQAEKDTVERIISYLGECDLERTILDFDSDGYANIDFESLEKLIRKAMEEE